jgi:hypothetical protein
VTETDPSGVVTAAGHRSRSPQPITAAGHCSPSPQPVTAAGHRSRSPQPITAADHRSRSPGTTFWATFRFPITRCRFLALYASPSHFDRLIDPWAYFHPEGLRIDFMTIGARIHFVHYCLCSSPTDKHLIMKRCYKQNIVYTRLPMSSRLER